MRNRPSKLNPPSPGVYMVRYQWHNKMTGRQFDEWIMRQWDGSKWNLFTGGKVVEWRHL